MLNCYIPDQSDLQKAIATAIDLNLRRYIDSDLIDLELLDAIAMAIYQGVQPVVDAVESLKTKIEE